MKPFLFLLLPFFICSSNLYAQKQAAAFLGVHFNSISNSKAKKLGFENQHGWYVTSVVGNTSAEKMGLKPFDYVIGFDGKTGSTEQSLSHVLQSYQAGDLAEVQYIRKGEARSDKVLLSSRADKVVRKKAKTEEAFFGVSPSHASKPKGRDGVMVKIVSNSSAEKMGLKNDDFITAINQYPLIDWHDLSTAIDAMRAGEQIQIDFIRDGKTYNQSIAVGSEQARHTNNEANSRELEPEQTEMNEAEPMDVDMVDVTQEEVDEMKKEKGIDMPIVNDLRIESLNLFPNPNQGVFTLTFDLLEEGQTSIRIFDSSARLIYSNELQTFSGRFNDRIDIADRVAEGIYFLEIRQGRQSISKKVIVKRP